MKYITQVDKLNTRQWYHKRD